jgi:hypothetical protein
VEDNGFTGQVRTHLPSHAAHCGARVEFNHGFLI